MTNVLVPPTEETLDATSVGQPAESERSFALPPGEIPVATTIGRYTVLGRLGAGGMGVVYAAHDPELERKVAVKLLHTRRRTSNDDDAAHRRILREAQAMAKVSHPNVVAVHDVGEHGGRIYLAMEFVEGRTLKQWLKEKPRDWPEVLAVLLRAARGLAAAHDKGLIHRDFKPDNVMIDVEERVRVVDFGLARRAADDISQLRVDVDSKARPRADAFHSGLTRAGSTLGTPAYMAPEQHLHMRVVPASDQFAFCVALYEALFHRRPFAGDTLAALALNVTQGKLVPLPPRTRVPAWLRRTVVRGLAVDASARWPSMDALIRALERGHGRVRVRRLAMAAAGLIAAGAGLFAYRGWQVDELTRGCEAEGASIAEVWSDDTRAAIEGSFARTGVSYANASAQKLMPWIDEQADALARARTDTCLDARVRGVWDAELLDRSLWCLEEQRMGFDALLHALAQADAGVVENAVSVAAEGLDLAACRDARRLLEAPLPPGPDERELVREIRTELARGAAYLVAADPRPGLEITRAATVRAESASWPPLVASARLQTARLLLDAGDFAGAETEMRAAYFLAARAGAIELATQAATSLVQTVGSTLARPEDGRIWARHAHVGLSRLGAEDDLRIAQYLGALAAVERNAGAFATAGLLEERALAIREAALGPDHPTVAISVSNLGHQRHATGDQAQALILFRRALAILERAYGPDHPDVALNLDNVAGVYVATGDYDAARPLFERALAIRERAFGSDHPSVADTLNDLATLYGSMGDYAETKHLLERSLAIREKTLGGDHPYIAASLSNLGNVEYFTGNFAGAKALYERALQIYQKRFGSEHPEVAQTLSNMGDAARALEAHDEARALYERALALEERTLGTEHFVLSFPLFGLAELALARKQAGEAIALAERAVSLREGAGAPSDLVAEVQFTLARALWESGRDPSRARTLAEHARDGYEQAGAARNTERDTVQTWLSAHGRPG